MVILALNCPDLTICPIFTTPDRYFSVETAPLCKMLEQLDNYSWRYCISKNRGIQKMLWWMHFGWLSSHWKCCVCTFWYLTPVSNFKAIRQLVTEILHLTDLGYTESVIMNAVVLVLGEFKIQWQRTSGGYLPSNKVSLQCIGNWQCYAILQLSRTDRHRQTNSLNAIVLQPIRGSTNKTT